MPENVQNKICTCKNVKGEKSSERKLRDPMKTGRPSVRLLTRHAFTINPCCEYGEERQVTGNKTITDDLLQEAGVCECVCGVSGTDKHLFLFFFFFSSIKWQWRKVMWEMGSFEHLSTTDSHCMNDIALPENPVCGTRCHMLYLHRNLPVCTTAMMLEHVHIRCWRPDISLIFRENGGRDVLESECCPSRAQRSPVPSLLRTDSASMMLFFSFNHVRLQRWFTKCLVLFCFVLSPIFWKVLLASN